MALQEELRSGRDINEDGKGHFELIIPNTVLNIIPTRQVGFVLGVFCVFFFFRCMVKCLLCVK